MIRVFRFFITVFVISTLVFINAARVRADNPAPQTSATTAADTQIAFINQQMTDAINQVANIVNQPVGHVAFDPSFHVGYFSPGWFHAGAIKPDFSTVDIRKTQEFPYAKFDYVRSNLNPDIMFQASELEFNKMTKYFYLDRTVPKKRLTEQEMQEINSLYRVIGKDERALTRLKQEQASPVQNLPKTPVISFAVFVLVAGAYFVLRRKSA